MHYEDSLDTDINTMSKHNLVNRPALVPEKFWDPVAGQVRLDALLKAYTELERMASRRAPGAPASPELYAINHRHPKLASSPEVNQRLHAACFTQEQAQLVYDLAHEVLLPMLEDLAGAGAEQADLDHLCQHFGGEERWRQIAPQLKAWGSRNLPVEAFQALSRTASGVKALHRLMVTDEPNLGGVPKHGDDQPDEKALKAMISDPRYWKQRDPAFIAKVTSGFNRLYGEG